MRRAMSGIGLALALASAMAIHIGPAMAALLPDGGVTAPEMAVRLRAAGFEAEQTTDRENDPLLNSAFEGARFSVYFYECRGRPRCKSIQFAAGWSQTGITPQRVADWNRTKRFGRVYLDRDGDPWIEMDVDLEHGATTEAVSNDIVRWVAVLREFRKYIGR